MIDLDVDSGRNFEGLDPRETQEALAEELSGVGEDEERRGLAEHQDEIGEGQKCDASAVGADSGSEAEGAEQDDAVLAPDSDTITRMVEALLFATTEPLDEASIADRLPAGADVVATLAAIQEQYTNRGINLCKISKKWRFVTAQDVAYVLEKEKVQPRRLSRAALETLAIIAYHQPCTRADIEEVRGVSVAKGSLDQLLEIGWVGLRGRRRDAPGRPVLFGTTQGFLEHFGLESVQDLPGVSDLKAAGLLDARLPPGFSVPSPVDGDDDEMDDSMEDDVEFAQDFIEEQDIVADDE